MLPRLSLSRRLGLLSLAGFTLQRVFSPVSLAMASGSPRGITKAHDGSESKGLHGSEELRAHERDLHPSGALPADKSSPLFGLHTPPSDEPSASDQNQDLSEDDPMPGQHRLVRHLLYEGRLLPGSRTAQVMLEVDRAKFVGDMRFLPGAAYEDCPLPIGWGQTVSAPHMHATALSLLDDVLGRPGCVALDVGSGSGYLTACMGLLVREGRGRVVGVEVVEQLASFGAENVRRAYPELLESGTVEMLAGDALSPEILSRGPFDAIHVGAAASGAVPPTRFIEALKPGGRMVIPVGESDEQQYFWKVEKAEDGLTVTETKLFAVRYVPLVPGRQDLHKPK